MGAGELRHEGEENADENGGPRQVLREKPLMIVAISVACGAGNSVRRCRGLRRAHVGRGRA